MRCLVEHSGTCLSAKDIMDMLPHIGEATVYRCLASLAEDGDVKKFISEKGQGSYYQFSPCGSRETHFHLKCTSCGRLIHLDCGFMKDFEEHVLTEHDFAVDNTRTVIYGVCAECRGENKVPAQDQRSKMI